MVISDANQTLTADFRGKSWISSTHFKRPLVKSDKQRFFGRRKGRPLNKQRREALRLLEAYGISSKLLESGALFHPKDLFEDRYDRFNLEIGFGNGEFLKNLLRNNPDEGFIGAEPFMNGVAALLKDLQDTSGKSLPGNLRIWPDDIRPLLEIFQSDSFDTIYILNPDPWPKKRHNKRRIVNPQTLDQLSKILRRGGKLIMTTDVDDLAEWMAIQLTNHSDFRWNVTAPSNSTEKPEGWLSTRYETKGKQAGRNQHYLTAKKL